MERPVHEELVDLLRQLSDAVALGRVPDGPESETFVQWLEEIARHVAAERSDSGSPGPDATGLRPHRLLHGLTPVFPRLDALATGAGSSAFSCSFGPAHEGPPGLVHGGFVAAAFDIVASMAAAQVHPYVVTRKLRVRYLRPVFLAEELRFEALAEREEGRSILVSGELRDSSSKRLAAIDAEFVVIDATRFNDRRSGTTGR